MTAEARTRQTDPARFRNPHSRKNRIARMLWTLTYYLLFRPSPWFMGAWRTWLLKCFGARIQYARLHQSVQIWAPWMLEIGSDVWIDMNVNLYNAFGLKIGDRVVISQNTFLCSATHDYTDPFYRLTGKQITIASDCWIAADAFVAPGVTVNAGSVVGARSVVVKDVPPWSVVAGNPAKVIKERKLRDE